MHTSRSALVSMVQGGCTCTDRLRAGTLTWTVILTFPGRSPASQPTPLAGSFGAWWPSRVNRTGTVFFSALLDAAVLGVER